MELLWDALDVLMSVSSARVDPVIFRQVSREARRVVDAHVTRLYPEPWESDATADRVLRRYVALRHIDIANSPVNSASAVLHLCSTLKTLVCTLEQLATGDDLLHVAQLQELSIRRRRASSQNFDCLLQLSSLRKLTVDYEVRLALPQLLCHRLLSLELKGFGKGVVTQDTFSSITSSESLRALCLRHSLDGIKEPLPRICGMTQLKALDISYNLRNREISDKNATLLNALVHLQALDVSYTKITSGALAQLSGLNGLQMLCACACGNHSSDVLALATTHSHLSCLDFSSSWTAKQAHGCLLEALGPAFGLVLDLDDYAEKIIEQQ